MDTQGISDSSLVRRLSSGLAVYVAALALAMALFSLLILLLGFNIPRALNTLLTTSFKSAFGFQETVKKMIPLIFTTYAFAIPFTIKFFNIGGWGQMLLGGSTTTVVALVMAPLGLSPIILVPLVLICGIVGGALLGGLAGYLKAKNNINPIISTIMLNFVAWQFVDFIATRPGFKDPLEGHPITVPLPDAARLGFFGGIPQSIIVAAVLVLFVVVLMKRTRFGYEINAVGQNLRAAETYGISFTRTILLAFLLGGGIAGLGGSLEVINIHGRLIEGFAQTSGAQFGIFGILTSLVVAGNPATIPIAAFLMSVVLVGADSLQRTMQVPVELVFLSQAIIVISVVTIRQRFAGRA